MWQRHLPHLREELYGEGVYVFIGQYGFQEEKEKEVSSNEVMAILLEKAAEEDLEENSVASSSLSESSGHEEESWNVNAEESGAESETVNCKLAIIIVNYALQ